MNEPIFPIAAAAGDPKKTLKAPCDGIVKRLLEIQTALSVEPGDPLVAFAGVDGPRILTAPAAGLIVYIPAKEGASVKAGDGLVYIL